MKSTEISKADDKYRIILEVNNTIISNLNMEDLLMNVANKLHEIFTFDVSTITLYDEESDKLVVTAFGELMGSKKLAPGTTLPLDDNHAGWVYQNNRPLVVNDLSRMKKFKFDELLLKEGLNSYVVVPLISRENILGTLNLGSKTSEAFRDFDTDFLQLIAKQVALAIENARYFDEINILKQRIEDENVYLQEEIRLEHNFEEIVGNSKIIKNVLKQVELVAVTDSTVLIRGETGSGKELIARAIHNLSTRKDRTLIKVNCPAIPSGLIESELFGHEKGAFTSAITKKIGKFELANCGTIFLDELGDLPLDAQSKLLRVLQEQEFERVGGTENIKVDVRIIAATNRNLEDAMEEGKFRSDLYFRLNVFPINLPSLRERSEDIPLLAKYFIQKYMNKMGKNIRSISDTAISDLQSYSWPGNIRELENVIERSVILSTGDKLQIPRKLFDTKIRADNKLLNLDELEKNHIISVLEHTSWRINGERGAAKILGLHPNTLRSRMLRLGVNK